MAKLKMSHKPDYPTLVNEYEYLHIFKIIDENTQFHTTLCGIPIFSR
jgi:hypothetical protein